MTDDDITKLREALKACMFYPSGRVTYPVPDWENCANPPRIARLLDALDEARRDAERYRWLRDKSAYVGINPHARTFLWVLRGILELTGQGFDAAIDAAMKEPTK